jgi:hypothetical protein
MMNGSKTHSPSDGPQVPSPKRRRPTPRVFSFSPQLSPQLSPRYVFSGARPSSGAASSACSNALDFCRHATCFGRAAPEDGRAPLNRDSDTAALLKVCRCRAAWIRGFLNSINWTAGCIVLCAAIMQTLELSSI